jgi:hypothetical protein
MYLLFIILANYSLVLRIWNQGMDDLKHYKGGDLRRK